ncbi:Multidrug export protein AcrE [Neochlamydia sp. AcF65]|uniref:efflux RND transporter periplasmic adaptor subunit n=1 Tax=Neochlamydia sp. AcF65 TaxID=2795735 RepID=UPI001BC94BC8|nr:efflux RND transporter periplasmic adaptor subunit [Neochlamydia sp. AcF65]MBS4166072.1 Multidrug export protein AcrE [Neochlamydia sp. AcF65]
MIKVDFLRPFLLIALMLLLATSCKGEKSLPPPPLVEVSALTIQKTTIPWIYESVGYAESSHQVEIRARVEGYLEEIAYIEGAEVTKGQLLFKLEQTPFIAAVEQAKGNLAREKAFLWNAQQTVERLTPLYAKHAASKKDLDEATANLSASQASVQVAEAALKVAEINLSYTLLTSPINGLSGKSSYRQGALISPGSNQLMTSITALDPIWISFSISENEILKIDKEVKNRTLVLPKDKNYGVEVILADGSRYPFRGEVNFSAPTYDQKTGTLSMRAQLPNPNLILKPGQFVRVKVKGAIKPNTIYVPQKALLESKTGMYVYIVSEGKAAIQNVTVGDWYGDDWIIEEGLREGDQVIVDGINKVGQGTPIKVTKEIKVDKSHKQEPILPQIGE